MEKIEKLNKKQIALMSQIRDEWIHTALHAGAKIDEEECTNGIKWLYYASNLKEPKIVFAKGPNDFSKKFAKIVRASVWDSVGASVWDSVGASVRASVWDSVGASVRASVRASVWDSVGASVRASVRDSVRASVSVFSLAYDADDAAWMEYWKQIEIVKNHEDLNKYLGYLKSGAFYVLFFEKYAFVIERPIAVYQNEQKRLHSEDKPSMEWRDGTQLYHLNGVSLEKDLWTKIVKDKFTAEQVLAIENTEHRRIAYEYMDKLKMRKLKDYTVLDHRDKDEQGKMDEIVQFSVKGFDDPFIYYSCECPTTGRRYFIQTEKKTCVEAKAMSFGQEKIEWTNEW